MRPLALSSAALVLAWVVARADLGGMFNGGLQHPAIQYFSRPVHDPVTELIRKVQDGSVRLEFDGSRGYLRSLLAALNIPVESQLVVFSRTSLLARLISPPHPRTIYFNDSVIVTWIPGEPFVELAGEDPEQGIIFYSINDKPAPRPAITRQSNNCLVCHDSLSSLGVPGTLVRSVLTSANGTPLSYLGDTFPDHRTPFTERWGGWYVTGKHVPAGHRGNARVSLEGRSQSAVLAKVPDLASLEGRLDSKDYLTPYSDIVALLVFDHQMHAMNLFTRLGWDVRANSYKGNTMPEAALREEAGELVDYLLFIDEWTLSSPVEGNSGFAEKFSAEGPRDRQGRSLRQFDLQHRLMRYPCSYMIYSPAFDGLPGVARDAVYRRMWQILSGQEHTARYSRLTSADRRAIVEILRDTRKGLPDYFNGAVQ